MTLEPLARVAAVLGANVIRTRSLGGGQIGRVVAVALADGSEVVAKTSPGVPLAVEAFMLRFLRDHSPLPVPEVLHADDDLLVLAMLPGRAGATAGAEVHAAELLAALHDRSAPTFGFERDTLIGPFRQPNEASGDWPAFFGRHRLRYMAEVAADRDALPSADEDRVRAVAEALPRVLDHKPRASLIHGDVWSGNVLARGHRVTGFLDPAIYFADPEVELAFIDLFGTFGRAFHDAYRESRPVDRAYEEIRRDVYQLYPLLVHVAAFGEGYLPALRTRLTRIEDRI